MSTSTKSSFWETIDLLISVEGCKSEKDKRDEADDWVDQLIAKRGVSEHASNKTKRTLESILKSSMRSDSSASDYSVRMHEDEVEKFISSLELPRADCKFSFLPVRNKLEMLVGSNLVSLTDRDYMLYLKVRMLDDYETAVNKRIEQRQVNELERVKNLVLSGKIPLDEAPIEMANHPVMLIYAYCKKVLAERRAKLKVLRPFIPKYLYWDDTPDPPSGLSIGYGHRLRPNNDRLYVPPELFLATEVSENVADGYMLTDEEFAPLHYESDEVKQLRETETVEEMYNAADEILGIIDVYYDDEVVEEEAADDAPMALNAVT